MKKQQIIKSGAGKTKPPAITISRVNSSSTPPSRRSHNPFRFDVAPFWLYPLMTVVTFLLLWVVLHYNDNNRGENDDVKEI